MPGEAVYKQRHRARVATGKNGKPYVQFYPDKKSADYEEYAGQCVLFQLRRVKVEGEGQDFTLPVTDCRIIAHIRFNILKPKSYSKAVVHMTKKPDLDNLVKSILDALVQGGVIHDDNCITDLYTMKRYVDDAHPEGVEVDLTVLPI